MKKRILFLIFFYVCLLSIHAETNNSDPQTLKEEPAFHLSHLDSMLSDILWCGGSQEIVLVLSDNGSVYRSTDKGFKWNKMIEIFQKTGYVEIESGENVFFLIFFKI